ncbi:MAG: hypothetical protein ACE5JI_11630 [Acidobacteriota bacterium]
MSFRESRQALILALQEGRYEHEARDAQAEKNKLAVGELGDAEVIRLLRRCRGTQYSESPHDCDPGVTVYLFRPESGGESWYVKAYFLSDKAVFISVHPSER